MPLKNLTDIELLRQTAIILGDALAQKQKRGIRVEAISCQLHLVTLHLDDLVETRTRRDCWDELKGVIPLKSVNDIISDDALLAERKVELNHVSLKSSSH